MYRLLATDIDDTLLAHDGSLPRANREALRNLHEAGVIIVFCSGRSDLSIRTIAAGILEPDDDEYYIAFNGARIVTAGTRATVARRYVADAAIAALADYARGHDLHLQGYSGDDFVVNAPSVLADRYAEATKTRYLVSDDLTAALPEGSPKLLFIGRNEHLSRHRTAIEALNDSLPPDDRFVTMFSKPHYLEIVATGVNKGKALKRLTEILGIPRDETLAVGDGENDVEMIRAAGTGVAVADAHEAARDAADEVLASGADDGAMGEIAERFFGTGLTP